jgi:hypothetical protein
MGSQKARTGRAPSLFVYNEGFFKTWNGLCTMVFNGEWFVYDGFERGVFLVYNEGFQRGISRVQQWFFPWGTRIRASRGSMLSAHGIAILPTPLEERWRRSGRCATCQCPTQPAAAKVHECAGPRI